MSLVSNMLDDRVTIYTKVSYWFKRIGIQWNSKVEKYIEYNFNSDELKVAADSCWVIQLCTHFLLSTMKTVLIFKHPGFLGFVKSILYRIYVIFI